jgi:hypothetical protein
MGFQFLAYVVATLLFGYFGLLTILPKKLAGK